LSDLQSSGKKQNDKNVNPLQNIPVDVNTFSETLTLIRAVRQSKNNGLEFIAYKSFFNSKKPEVYKLDSLR